MAAQCILQVILIFDFINSSFFLGIAIYFFLFYPALGIMNGKKRTDLFKNRMSLMENKKDFSFWIKALVVVICLQTLILMCLGLYVIRRFNTLQSTLQETQDLVDDRIISVGQEMEQVLSQQTSLTSNFYYTLQPAPRGKILLTLNADLKRYSAGSAVSFTVTADNGETSLVKTNLSSNSLTASVTLPVCDTIKVGLVVTDNQNTMSQALAEITDVSDCLTDHLFLTPDLVVKQSGADLFLSGSYNLLNEYGTWEERQLDMVRLEISQGGTPLHTFYFSQDYETPLADGQNLHVLLFEKIEVQPEADAALTFAVRARDKGGFEYYCVCETVDIDPTGVAAPVESHDTRFRLIE